MGLDKNMLPECEDCGRENSAKYNGEYYRGYDDEYDMKECDHHECDKRCGDKEYDRECDRKCDHHNHDKKCDVKVLQSKVIKGTGCETFFLEADFDFPVGTPLYLIESIDTWVDVYDTKVICENKVIFNAWVYKNIIYKVKGTATAEECGGVTVTGGVDHITKAIPLAGCIDIDTKCCEKLNPKVDCAEVLKAYVIGDVEDKLEKYEVKNGDMPFNPPVFVYGSLHEKMCVRIDLKVVRWEHVTVEVKEKC